MKICLTSLATKEMQTKTSMKNHFTPPTVAIKKVKKQMLARVWRD